MDSAPALARYMAQTIGADLRAATEARGEASLVVSGGRTPLAMFRELSNEPLSWERIRITLADERWVPATSRDSNERLVRENLLVGAAARASFFPLKTDAPTPEAGEAECARRLDPIARPFDVVVLGMGDNGHTASLFPDAPELPRLLAPGTGAVCGAANPASATHPRMSLTLATLLDAHRILLHLEGESKWATYRRACGPGPVAAMPVRAVLRQDRVPVEVFWAP